MFELRVNEEITDIERLKPNPWNHNEQSEFMQEKLGKSLELFGQVAEIIVREKDDYLEIIDGEHRYLELIEAGETKVLVNNLGVVPDDDAKLLTAVMNELRGDRNPTKLSLLLNSLSETSDWDELIDVLPFTTVELDNLMKIASDIPKEPSKKTLGDGDGKPTLWVDMKVSVHEDEWSDVKELMRTAKTKLGVSKEPDEALENGRLLKILLGHG